MAKNPDLYKKRYKTLKEHRAAVAARKALKGGKNKGPVANAAAYGETIKKPKVKPIPKLSKKQKSIAAQSGNPNKIEASDLKKLRSSKGKAVKNKDKAIRNFSQSASGTRGALRPSNPPSPTVLRRGSKTGASVDPRERGLKKISNPLSVLKVHHLKDVRILLHRSKQHRVPVSVTRKPLKLADVVHVLLA